MKNQTSTVRKYREAAVKLFGISEDEAERCIIQSNADAGQNAPHALVILRLEHGLDALSFHGPDPLGATSRLDVEANAGTFTEYVNGAVAAIYEV